MREDLEKRKFENLNLVKSERKAIRAGLGLFFTLAAISLLLLYLNADKIRVGAWWLFGTFAAALAALGTAAGYVVLYIKKLVHIKASRGHVTGLLVLIVIIAACASYFAVECAADIFGGAHEITTNEYKIYDNTELHFTDGGEKTYVFIPKEVGGEIAKAPLVSDDYSEAVNENGLYIHTESVYIKYYPRSKVLIEARK